MIKYKVAFDEETQTWRILEKICITIGKLSWCIKQKGFLTKESAIETMKNILKDSI